MVGKRFDGSEIVPGKYSFPGWWSEAEKADDPTPWEEWEIALIGTEAGDIVTDEYDIDEVLSISGYCLLLIPGKEERIERIDLPVPVKQEPA